MQETVKMLTGTFTTLSLREVKNLQVIDTRILFRYFACQYFAIQRINNNNVEQMILKPAFGCMVHIACCIFSLFIMMCFCMHLFTRIPRLYTIYCLCLNNMVMGIFLLKPFCFLSINMLYGMLLQICMLQLLLFQFNTRKSNNIYFTMQYLSFIFHINEKELYIIIQNLKPLISVQDYLHI